MLSEGKEEFIQTYVDAGAKAVLGMDTGGDFWATTKEAGTSFVMGCACAGIMNGASSLAYNNINVHLPNGEVLSLSDYTQ